MKIVFNGNVLADIVQELSQREIPFEISYEEEAVIVEGFYKLNKVELKEDSEGNVTAYTRYNQETEITCFYDLVDLNYSTFTIYRNTFREPDSDWVDTLLEFELLKKTTKTITEYY